jgi:hypothetical protein
MEGLATEMLTGRFFAGAREIWLRRGKSGTYEVGWRASEMTKDKGTNDKGMTKIQIRKDAGG